MKVLKILALAAASLGFSSCLVGDEASIDSEQEELSRCGSGSNGAYCCIVYDPTAHWCCIDPVYGAGCSQ